MEKHEMVVARRNYRKKMQVRGGEDIEIWWWKMCKTMDARHIEEKIYEKGEEIWGVHRNRGAREKRNSVCHEWEKVGTDKIGNVTHCFKEVVCFDASCKVEREARDRNGPIIRLAIPDTWIATVAASFTEEESRGVCRRYLYSYSYRKYMVMEDERLIENIRLYTDFWVREQFRVRPEQDLFNKLLSSFTKHTYLALNGTSWKIR